LHAFSPLFRFSFLAVATCFTVLNGIHGYHNAKRRFVNEKNAGSPNYCGFAEFLPFLRFAAGKQGFDTQIRRDRQPRSADSGCAALRQLKIPGIFRGPLHPFIPAAPVRPAQYDRPQWAVSLRSFPHWEREGQETKKRTGNPVRFLNPFRFAGYSPAATS